MVCPSRLVLDFSGSSIPDGLLSQVLITSGNKVVWKDTVSLFAMEGDYDVSVPKGVVHVRVWAGADDMSSLDGLIIPLGQDCPEIYTHDSDVNVMDEECVEIVNIRKNHCVMTVMPEGEGYFPFKMSVTGNVEGYTADGKPKTGNFECVLDDNSSAEGYQVVLPRQIDTSLLLHVDDGSGNLKSFAIGQYLESVGYDWEADNLEDVTIVLDYALTYVQISVHGWESVYVYEIVI